MRIGQLNELEDALKTANATLFSVKSELIDAQATIAKLRAQEAADRQKIQHLLALTQPITEEVRLSCAPLAHSHARTHLLWH